MRAAAAFLAVWASSAAVGWAQFSPFLVEPVGGPQLHPYVSGSLVVWAEFIDGDYAVRGKDLTTGDIFLVDRPGATETGAVTDGKLLVWADDRAGNYNVYAMDLATGQEWPIVEEFHSQGSPVLAGDFVVWRDSRSSPSGLPPEYGNSDIYAMGLRTGKEFAVCTAMWDQESPAISGDIIVWTDYRRANPVLNPLVSDIHGYEISTGREFLIASAPDNVRQVKPAISGNIVVWADMHNGGDIWGYDLSSESKFPIHVGLYGQNDADIDGRYVVWVDRRNGVDADIWGYDLLTGREFPVFQGPGDQKDPSISGDLVVWYTYIPGEDARIWAAYIPEPATGLLLAAGGLAGLALRRRSPGLASAGRRSAAHGDAAAARAR